jgi:Fe-S-cluster containining protein
LSNEIITRIDLIEQLARKRERSDIRFRTWVRSSDISDQALDALVGDTATEVEKQIDCTTCANCCRTMQVVVDDDDIRRLAKSLQLPAKELERRYVRRAPDGTRHFATSPCPFLEGSRCSVYGVRPESCRDFPYLHTEGFRRRMLMMIDNTALCPIVFNTYARLKARMGFRERR